MGRAFLHGQSGGSSEDRFLYGEYTGWIFGTYEPNYTYTDSSFTSSQNSVTVPYPFTVYGSASLSNGVVTLSDPTVITASNVDSISFNNKWFPTGSSLYRINTTSYSSETRRQLMMNGYYRVKSPNWIQILGNVFSKNFDAYPSSPEDGPWKDGYYYEKKTTIEDW